MNYFCSRCNWEGDTIKVQHFEKPNMVFEYYAACPMCAGHVIENNPNKMVFGRWYGKGSFMIRWV